jgi:hypothetical protein
LETKVEILILGIVVLLAGFTMFLFLGSFNSAFVSFGAYAIIIGFIVTLFGFVEIGTDKASLRASKRKIIVLALIVIAAGLTVQYSVWTIVTPNWAFSVTTDQLTYELGEPVHIVVTLENLGFIAHSFTSAVSDPVVVQIRWGILHTNVWYSHPFHIVTDFTVAPHQSLERTFTWNQTNTANPQMWNQTYMPGTYVVRAWIPHAHAPWIYDPYDSHFSAETRINITSS